MFKKKSIFLVPHVASDSIFPGIKLPRPFRFPVRDDFFQQIRIESKWFKNIRLFRVDESIHFEKKSKNEKSVSPGQIAAMNERSQQLVTHPDRGRAIVSLPFIPRVEISQELAVRAIKAIAEICGATVHELQEICFRKPDFIDYLSLNSLLSVAIIERLKTSFSH